MRKMLSLALILLLQVHLISPAIAANTIASQIAAMPAGTRVEVRLKNKTRIKGIIGPGSASGFTLTDPDSRAHRIAFDDVALVKQITSKSHVRRNVLIGVGIGVAAIGITAAILLRCGPLGCGFHPTI